MVKQYLWCFAPNCKYGAANGPVKVLKSDAKNTSEVTSNGKLNVLCLESSFSSNMKKSSALLRKFCRNPSFGGVVAIFHVAMTA